MKKKLFAIFALLIVVAGITAVSAFDLGDLMGSSEPQNTTDKELLKDVIIK